jgi:hypothetical protein
MMNVTGFAIDSKPKLVPTMGDPYAFVGGMVDLDPWNASYMKVGDNIILDIEFTATRAEADEAVYRGATLKTDEEGGWRGTLRVDFETFGPDAGGLPAILDYMRLMEGHEAAPDGITDAFVAWLVAQGVEV